VRKAHIEKRNPAPNPKEVTYAMHDKAAKERMFIVQYEGVGATHWRRMSTHESALRLAARFVRRYPDAPRINVIVLDA
jgi:hypothetical protein